MVLMLILVSIMTTFLLTGLNFTVTSLWVGTGVQKSLIFNLTVKIVQQVTTREVVFMRVKDLQPPQPTQKKKKRDSYLPWATGLRFPLAATSSRMKNQSFVMQNWNTTSWKTTKNVDGAQSHLVVVLLLVGVSKHGDGDVFVLGDRPDAHPDVRTFHRWLPLHRITHHTSAIVAWGGGERRLEWSQEIG